MVMVNLNFNVKADVFEEKEVKNEILILTISIISGIILLIFSNFYLQKFGLEALRNIINILALSVFIVPISILKYAKHRELKEIEERFPDFMRELVEGLRGGMTLPLALKYAARGDYGALNKHINKIVSQISWGLPFEKVFEDFAKSVKSKVVARAVSVIIESHRSGGELSKAIESITQATAEVEKIKKERKAVIAGQMTQGYLIFFIFIGILIGIQEFLLPALSSQGFNPALAGGTSLFSSSPNLNNLNQQPMVSQTSQQGMNVNRDEYITLFGRLAIIQGVFAGLVIGKLTEGTVSAGAKHSIIMSMLGYGSIMLAHFFLG